ncbi:carbonic anhydrase family protein [Sunxiuqinia dokdonensis]|uniref:Carbonic anhydrase n=1 Tax=Sunxiuqinia dokdonensis TaxID=1409788 RepID=A0A0L8V6S7_9BACT|nr:carbonic anhydrase family protein [Sunxiuqinia dokdonensis]KOH43922.1 carbonic anhydrase [Sunxiuqinia dokdonensis]
MWAHTKETQDKITPQQALEFLKEGNVRFLKNLKVNRNLLMQVNQTSEGQFPFATILSCIDSRTSAELIFDQGLGDIFSIRIAGNVLNDDILGSMEYACGVANSKIIVVLGHTRCGAVISACDQVKLGHITGLLQKIKPAIESETTMSSERNGQNLTFVNRVSEINVQLTINQIRQQSPILSDLEKDGKIIIVGGIYDVETGIVSFF